MIKCTGKFFVFLFVLFALFGNLQAAEPLSETVLYVSFDNYCNCEDACYSSIDEGCSVAPCDSMVKVESGFYEENLIFENSCNVTLSGGWNKDYTVDRSMSILNGTLSIRAGSVVISNIEIGTDSSGLYYVYYRDKDSDGYGNPADSIQKCSLPAGYVADNSDADDSDNTIYPGAPELCDGKDNDQDGEIDEYCHLLALHVHEDVILDSDNNVVTLKSINFDHYMDYFYTKDRGDPASEDDFHERLEWSHTREDYCRVKEWGLNCVRLDISHEHIANQKAFENIKKQIRWAGEAGLYIIIAYFVPPGSVYDKGYYSDKAFFDDIRDKDGKSLKVDSDYLSQYLTHWEDIVVACKGMPHVIYELLNEPQLLSWANDGENYTEGEFGKNGNLVSLKPCVNDEFLYINLVKKTIDRIRQETGDQHIIIVDGLNYANPDPDSFRFIYELKKFKYSNLVYSFHYYHPENFVWSECALESYLNQSSGDGLLLKEEPGFVQVVLPEFTTEDTSVDVEYRDGTKESFTCRNLTLKIVSNNQPGTYWIKKVEVVEKTNSGERVIMSENFNSITEQVVKKCPFDGSGMEGVLRGDPWDYTTFSNNQWGSAWGSSVRLFALPGDENAICISSTVNKDEELQGYGYNGCTGVQDGLLKEGRWAALMLHAWGNEYSDSFPLMLEDGKNYFIRIKLKGEHLNHFGSLSVTLLGFVEQIGLLEPDDDYPGHFSAIELTPAWTKGVYCYEDYDPDDEWSFQSEKLSSDLSMIEADFDQLEEIAQKHKVPLFLGEFGVPIRNVNFEDGLTYFQKITESAEERGFGWSLYSYRDPFSSEHESFPGENNARLRTLSLYSGWGVTVEEIIDEIADKQKRDPGWGTDVDNDLFYYRPKLIGKIKEICGE